VAFRPDGAVLATGGTGRVVALWDPDTAERIRTLPARSVDALSFSGDGLELAAAAEGAVYVWSLDPGDRPPLKWRHQRGLCALSFGADGRLFGGGIGVWSWPAGATTPDWTALTGTPVDAVAVNADHTILAVAAADQAIHLWRLGPSGLPSRDRADQRLAGHSGMITGLAFDPDGRTLASCATKTEIRVWRPAFTAPSGRRRPDRSAAGPG
jgi:WD40 repeat protein